MTSDIVERLRRRYTSVSRTRLAFRKKDRTFESRDQSHAVSYLLSDIERYKKLRDKIEVIVANSKDPFLADVITDIVKCHTPDKINPEHLESGLRELQGQRLLLERLLKPYNII